MTAESDIIRQHNLDFVEVQFLSGALVAVGRNGHSAEAHSEMSVDDAVRKALAALALCENEINTFEEMK